jgi:hypothetical protein
VPSRAIYALLLCVFVTSVPAPADILFTDTTFDPANYNGFSATPVLNSGVTATYGQCPNCGNTGTIPDPALQALVSIPDRGGAFVGFLNSTFVYNPQTQGAIDSINASVDKDLTLSSSSTDFASYFYPLIEQDGLFYIASIPGGTINSGTTTNYENIAATGLGASDFGLYDFGTTSLPDFDSNPDFSATGGAITLGLAPLVSANAPYNITVDYDNLSFDIIQSGTTQSPVPESSSLGLLSIFLTGIVLRGLKPAARWKLKRR